MVFRIIQVGMGGWGRNWAELMGTAPELVEVVAHVEVVPELRELTRTQLGVPAERIYSDLATALEAHPDAA
ncbi:MAG: gfo/Idh/MocA family oxidoreductase, partial [Parafilimonas terrae]|nr:gfo/Idh/MocA family oxidoreductase [Parafilimonas terrae]